MKTCEGVFTGQEICLIRDALATETVGLRKHVKAQGRHASERAEINLRVLEGLLAWAKEKAARCE